MRTTPSMPHSRLTVLGDPELLQVQQAWDIWPGGWKHLSVVHLLPPPSDSSRTT